jgi:hypothetical protein
MQQRMLSDRLIRFSMDIHESIEPTMADCKDNYYERLTGIDLTPTLFTSEFLEV